MNFSFKEKASKFYRILLLQYLPEGTQGRYFVKKFVYQIALFLAKRNGFIPYFFNEKEKEYNSLSVNQQYQIGLSNNFSPSDIESKKQNNFSTRISIIISINKNDIKNFEKTIKSIITQTYKNWELILVCSSSEVKRINSILLDGNLDKIKILDNNGNNSRAINKTISELKSHYVIFLDCTGTLAPDALYEIVSKVDSDENLKVIYADEDYIDQNNIRTDPFFKPSWSPHLLLSFNYLGKFVTYRVDLLKSINGFDESLKDGYYDLILRASRKDSKIGHIPKVLYSKFKTSNEDVETNIELESDRRVLQKFLEKNELSSSVVADMRGFFIHSPQLKTQPLISIIIPTRDSKIKLKACLQSISKSTYHNYEIIIVSNNSNKETRNFLRKTEFKVLEFNEPFNFSKINNFASRHAKGEYLIFLNDDTEVINSNWIESMLFYSIQNNIGVVGSLLLFPKSILYPKAIQQAGVSIGVSGPAIHAFAYSHYDKKHYFNLDKVVRNVSAVTAACMMIKTRIFKDIGGFDEKFKVVFGDTDLCLRIKQAGYYIVYNPNVTLYHDEGSSRGVSYPLDDEILFLSRWEDYIIKGDEFYNPNLSHLDRNFRLNPYFIDSVPISLLLEIYFFRKDLQQRFTNLRENISSLIDWAATEGVSSDISRSALLPYNKYYLVRCSDKVMTLAEAIYQFNHNADLQSKFIEVFSGKYDNLLYNYKTKGFVGENKKS